MNQALQRATFSPTRGASMAAMHASPASILPQRIEPHNAPNHRSCKDLGVCQSRTPACADCLVHQYGNLVFAPGVIERLPLSRRARLKQALMDVATLFVAAAAAAWSWGYVAAMAFKAGWL